MRRRCLVLLSVVLLAAPATSFPPVPPPKDRKPDAKPTKGLEGTWELTKLERGGGGGLKLPAGYQMIVKITDKTFTQTMAIKGAQRESPPSTLTLDTTKSPPWFDVTTKGAKEARMKGVYKVDGDSLVLVYATLKAARPGKVDGDLAAAHLRMTLKRSTPAAKGAMP